MSFKTDPRPRGEGLFDEFVVVLGAPLRSAAGADLLVAVRAHAPDKEIRYAEFGHHHPRHGGGLRPLIHAGGNRRVHGEGSSRPEPLARQLQVTERAKLAAIVAGARP